MDKLNRIEASFRKFYHCGFCGQVEEDYMSMRDHLIEKHGITKAETRPAIKEMD
jgi:hypothetical protein